MKIEVGKTYLTVNGSKVFIHCEKNNPNKFPFIGEFEDGTLHCYMEDGKFVINDSTHIFNIISEYQPKIVINFELDRSKYLKDLNVQEIEEAIRFVIDDNYPYTLSNGHSLTRVKFLELLKNSDFKITLLDK